MLFLSNRITIDYHKFYDIDFHQFLSIFSNYWSVRPGILLCEKVTAPWRKPLPCKILTKDWFVISLNTARCKLHLQKCIVNFGWHFSNIMPMFINNTLSYRIHFLNMGTILLFCLTPPKTQISYLLKIPIFW
jgi:hypothetical protein